MVGGWLVGSRRGGARSCFLLLLMFVCGGGEGRVKEAVVQKTACMCEWVGMGGKEGVVPLPVALLVNYEAS